MYIDMSNNILNVTEVRVVGVCLGFQRQRVSVITKQLYINLLSQFVF